MTALLAGLLIGGAGGLRALGSQRTLPCSRRCRRCAAGRFGRAACAESAKEPKYAEIRDNETDYRTGKLSDVDYRDA